MKRIAQEDLDHVLAHTKEIWLPVKGKSIFITGATGFFGKWLLETFLYINNSLQLNATVCALSRNPDKFLSEYPFYANEQSIRFIKGDIQDFEFPEEAFNYIIHAATDADAKLNTENPLLMLDTITIGTRHILDFAKKQESLEAFLLTSSGAVNGKQSPDVSHVKEDDGFFIDINNPTSAYAEGKRLAELYCAIYSKQFGVPVKIARCFAFVGLYLPLDKHFAIGNFLLNALNNEDIIIKGDGTTERSYLYAADLAIWLWTILLKGEANVPYNVGSDEAMSTREIAKRVATIFENRIQYTVLGKPSDKPTDKYVPDISFTRDKLNLSVLVGVTAAISKTKFSYQQ